AAGKPLPPGSHGWEPLSRGDSSVGGADESRRESRSHLGTQTASAQIGEQRLAQLGARVGAMPVARMIHAECECRAVAQRLLHRLGELEAQEMHGGGLAFGAALEVLV